MIRFLIVINRVLKRDNNNTFIRILYLYNKSSTMLKVLLFVQSITHLHYTIYMYTYN